MKKSKLTLVLALTMGIVCIPSVKSMAAVNNGWEMSNGKWYYYSSGSMCTGWVKDGISWYYMDNSGIMKTGWLKHAGAWYYLGSNGSMKTGWINDGNDWYYLNSSGAMATGWLNDRGTWYYLNSDGTMRTGTLIQGSKEYYLDGNGAMKTGWFQRYDDLDKCNKWYYAEGDGNMKKGWFYDNNLWYYLTEDGSLASNINAGGYYINKDGIWDKSGDDKVILAAGKESYGVNDNNLVVKLINNTDKTVKYKNSFSVERYENGQWVKIGDTRTNDDGEIEAGPNALKVTITDFIGFRDKIKAGKYRFGAEVEGQYMYAEFNLTGMQNDGNVELSTEKENYYLNETETIPYTITNNTYGKITYDSSYKIEKLVGGNYVDVKLKDTGSQVETYELNDGESAGYSISLGSIDEKLMPGSYTIAKKINGKYIYRTFNLSNDNIAKMSTDEHYYFDNDDKITLTITNETDKELSYGRAYTVEKWDYEKGWIKIPLKNDTFTEEAILLQPNGMDTQTIDISNIDEEHMHGDYRIVKEFDGNEVYAVFSYGYALQENNDDAAK